MEYCGNGSLQTVLRHVNTKGSPNFWNPTGIGIIICGAVFGMRFVRSKGFIHQDLKPSTILIDSFGHALIGDFGTRRLETHDATLAIETGTLYYTAPKMFKEGEYTNQADVFSFGLVLSEILVGSAVVPS
jgi:serine/threonine protein kinase